MNLFHYIKLCFIAYFELKYKKIAYFSVLTNGVPSITLFVARDREAWRVVQYAIEAKLSEERKYLDA